MNTPAQNLASEPAPDAGPDCAPVTGSILLGVVVRPCDFSAARRRTWAKNAPTEELRARRPAYARFAESPTMDATARRAYWVEVLSIDLELAARSNDPLSNSAGTKPTSLKP
jgi:hypothetical protein